LDRCDNALPQSANRFETRVVEAASASTAQRGSRATGIGCANEKQEATKKIVFDRPPNLSRQDSNPSLIFVFCRE
jgi:hypothetical protein